MNHEQKPTEDAALSRRKFMQGAAGASALLSAPAVAWRRPSAPSFRQAGRRKAIIIGSGFGGAITALRLAEQGVETLLLEKGKRWILTPNGDTFSPYLPPDGRSTWLSNFSSVPLGPPIPVRRHVGVLEGRSLGGLKLMSGAAYGGGSIVYGGLHVKPTRENFERVFPAEVSYDELETYYERFAAKVRMSTTPEDVYQTEYYQHYRVVEQQAQRAGLVTERLQSATDWDIVRREIAGEIKPSAIHGEAIYGVNSGAKRSLDGNYLREAEASGFVEAKTLHQVTDIAAVDGGYEVRAEIIDEDGTVVDRVIYGCEYLFLAAGSIGTTSLLVKAKALGLLPQLNDEVGAGFGNNGNVYALRTQLRTAMGSWQGGPPSIGIQDFDNPISPLFIEHPQLPVGFDIRSLLYFGVGLNPTRGRFYYDAAKGRVELDWPREGNGQELVNRAMLHTMRRLNEANGGTLNPLIFGRTLKDDAVYHPLGGAVMGKACDFHGRVKGYDRLYVMDGALIPGSTACANPAFTIAAVAERNVERVIEEDL